jgi:hypothetical protein
LVDIQIQGPNIQRTNYSRGIILNNSATHHWLRVLYS